MILEGFSFLTWSLLDSISFFFNNVTAQESLHHTCNEKLKTFLFFLVHISPFFENTFLKKQKMNYSRSMRMKRVSGRKNTKFNADDIKIIMDSVLGRKLSAAQILAENCNCKWRRFWTVWLRKKITFSGWKSV